MSIYALNLIGAVANMVHPLSSTNEIESYLKISESKYLIVLDLRLQKLFD